MFQEYVDKEYDLRVNAFEDRAIGIAIYSQESDVSKVDFRRYDFDSVPYRQVELPSEIAEFSVGILRHYGLSFGALDFVKNKKEEYYFLELNPNGQWLWLEKMSRYNLVKPFVDNLLK